MNDIEKGRKIIEIYVKENKEDETIAYEFIRCEDTEIANSTMKEFCKILTLMKCEEDDLEVEIK